jgi:predicted glycosyltransferase
MLTSHRKIMIYVQHLLGVGHLRRANYLASALAAAGLKVDLVSGGNPVDLVLANGVNFHQLVPAHCRDAQFNPVLDQYNNPIDDDWKSKRTHQLLEIYNTCQPDCLITETFPFGRRMFRFELVPLIDQAKKSQSRPLLISSIRDILQPKSWPERNLEICDRINSVYDHILVHADPDLSVLSDSFALADQIENKVSYTGYILEDSSSEISVESQYDVIVSVGGSNTGLAILETAILARQASAAAHLSWLLLVPKSIDDQTFQKLQSNQDSNLTIQRNRPDFAHLLQRAQLSISQAGYNTMMNILESKTRSIVIPFSNGNEIEQQIRADLFAKNGRVVSIRSPDLSTDSLAKTIDITLAKQVQIKQYKTNGAVESANLITHWVESKI